MPKITNTDLPIPKEFICSITQEIMAEPVATADGQVYEKKAIEEWFTKSNKSPITNLPLANKKLIPIPLIKSQIQEFLQKNKVCDQKEFLAAVKTGDPKTVERLNYLEEHLHSPTALFIAVRGGYVEMVNYLLTNGADPNNCLSSSGWTVLQDAIANSCTDDDDSIDKRYIEIIKLLLAKGADPDQHDFAEDEEYPIIMAASKGLTEIVEHLIKFKAELEVFEAYSGYTALHIAAANNYLEIAELLLQHAPELVNFADMNDETPLHDAARKGHKEMAALLLAEGADYKALNKQKQTPAQVALKAGKQEMAEAIPLMYQAIKRLAIKNASKSIQLEALIKKQQEEINALTEKMQQVLSYVNMSSAKLSGDYSPKLFK